MEIVRGAGRRTAVLWMSLVLTTLTAAASDALPDAANWISNPSFEEGDEGDPVDWAFFKEHETTVGRCDAAAGRDGSRGVAIEGGGGLAFGRWITPYRIPLEPDAEYRVSFWYRGDGGQVYVVGQPAELQPDGTLTINVNKRFKATVAKPEPSADWTRHEATFRAPSRPTWVQLCLSGGGRKSCAFDDVSVERPGLTLLDPRVPQVVPSGTVLRLVVSAPELRARTADSVRWTTGPTVDLQDARRDDAAGGWVLTAVAAASGPLEIACETGEGRTLRLDMPRMVRVFPAGAERLFTVGAFTDAHFYRPGSNERNDLFGQTVATLDALDPLFAVSLGDQLDIHNGLRDEEKKWICTAVREQFDRLSLPVFTIAGNHEIDRCYEGPGTRWYQEKYLGQPRFWGFRVGQAGFAGVDVSTPGRAAREHGGSFLEPAQDRWLADWLDGSEPRSVVLCGHISPFGDWSRTPDRDRFLTLLLGGKVSTYLCGHEHLTADAMVATGGGPPWPKPVPSRPGAAPSAEQVAVLTTTTACAFPLGNEKTLGYRYVLVKDGRLAWHDVLPPSLKVERRNAGRQTIEFVITNGGDKAVVGLPLVAPAPGRDVRKVKVTVDGSPLPFESVPLADGGQVVCARVDIPKNTTTIVRIAADDARQE